METFIIVGLGNPGREYATTRHNVGWIALDFIAKELGIKISKIKFKATYGETITNGKKIILLKPQTFMNSSGISVKAAAEYYKIRPQNIIVISDDINLQSNKIRIRKSGSDGGHNGLANIIYARIKLLSENKDRSLRSREYRYSSRGLGARKLFGRRALRTCKAASGRIRGLSLDNRGENRSGDEQI